MASTRTTGTLLLPSIRRTAVCGQEWELVKELDGAGNSSDILLYETIDSDPYSGISYYRLKQTDFDGAFEYFPMDAVQLAKEWDTRIYPNPASSQINVSTKEIERAYIRMIDSRGRELPTMGELYGVVYRMDVSHLLPGNYLIHIDVGGESDVRMVIVE